MLTRTPVPAQSCWDAACQLYNVQHRRCEGSLKSGGEVAGDGSKLDLDLDLAVDLLRAHRSAGLLRCCFSGDNDKDRCGRPEMWKW